MGSMFGSLVVFDDLFVDDDDQFVDDMDNLLVSNSLSVDGDLDVQFELVYDLLGFMKGQFDFDDKLWMMSVLLHLDDQFLNNKLMLDNKNLDVLNDDLQVMNDGFGDDNNWVSDNDLGNLNSQFGVWDGLLGDLMALLDQFNNDLDLVVMSSLFHDKDVDFLL